MQRITESEMHWLASMAKSWAALDSKLQTEYRKQWSDFVAILETIIANNGKITPELALRARDAWRDRYWRTACFLPPIRRTLDMIPIQSCL